MTRAEDLLQALNAIKQAASSELSGEAREAALHQIKGLFQLAGFDGEDTGEGSDEAPVPLIQAIASVRAQAEGELSGNAFQLAAKSLDDIAALSSAAEPVLEQAELPQTDQPEEAASPPIEPFGQGFDTLSQASKARVEHVAASLGIQTIHHHVSPLHDAHQEIEHHEAEHHETPAAAEETPPADDAIEPQSAREVAEATHDFGTPALATGQVPEYATPHKVDEAEPLAEAFALKAEPAARVPETLPKETAAPKVATAQSVETVSVETVSKEKQEHQEKTFFSLWLDMLFGRKK